MSGDTYPNLFVYCYLFITFLNIVIYLFLNFVKFYLVGQWDPENFLTEIWRPGSVEDPG